MFRRGNHTSLLVGWKTHPTILPRPGIELTTSPHTVGSNMVKVSHALNHSATAWVAPLHTGTSAVFCIRLHENLNQNSEMLCLLWYGCETWFYSKAIDHILNTYVANVLDFSKKKNKRKKKSVYLTGCLTDAFANCNTYTVNITNSDAIYVYNNYKRNNSAQPFEIEGCLMRGTYLEIPQGMITTENNRGETPRKKETGRWTWVDDTNVRNISNGSKRERIACHLYTSSFAFHLQNEFFWCHRTRSLICPQVNWWRKSLGCCSS